MGCVVFVWGDVFPGGGGVMLKHVAFLDSVRAYVAENPDAAAYVTQFVADGLRESLSANVERAADMEVALAIALATRHKTVPEVIREKLAKWRGKTSLRWDWV